MNKSIKVSIYFDKRRVLKNGTFPVKLLLTNDRIPSYISTGLSLSESDYKKCIAGKQRDHESVERWNQIQAMHKKAVELAAKNPFITTDEFKQLYEQMPSRAKRITFTQLMNELIQEKLKQGKFKSANNDSSSLHSITNFKGREVDFFELSKSFFQEYERWMRGNNKSAATIGIYTRVVRTCFNLAIERNLVSRERYPFGRSGYSPPTSDRRNISLTSEQKDKLFNYKPVSIQEQQALDAFKFSYYCYGMNFIDMAYLTDSNLSGDIISYIRRKTSTTERNSSIISCVIHPNAPFPKGGFKVFSDKDSPLAARKKIDSWITNTNKYLKRIAASLCIPPVTTYTARHTAASTMSDKGATLRQIQNALGHSSIEVTQGYLATLDTAGLRKLTGML